MIEIKEMTFNDFEEIKDILQTEFDEFCQIEAIAYGMKNYIPLPRQYASSTIPKEKSEELQSKRFVEAIKEIEYFSEISGDRKSVV